MRILVTGAAGFLGRRVVAQAIERGHHVQAVVRPGRCVSEVFWDSSTGVRVVEIDLSVESSVDKLADSLTGVDVVIHTAGNLHGNDTDHRNGTVEPTRRLIDAMYKADVRRLVLISSLSVYGYAALPDGAQLDETTPTEQEPANRDAYCRAKLAQEMIAIEAAQLHGMLVTSLRPGVIYGPGRLWSMRLGFAVWPLGLLLGGRALIPLSYVEHCALAVVLAAERDVTSSDVYVESTKTGIRGAFEAINVIDDDPPTQEQYAALLKKYMRRAPFIFIRVPWTILKVIAIGVGILSLLVPKLGASLPGILKPPTLHARAKPLRYSNCRLHDRLSWVSLVDRQYSVAASARQD